MKNFLQVFFALTIFLLSNSLCAQVAPAIEWQKCLGGSNSDVANSIQITGSGEFVIAGSSKSTDGDVSLNHGGYDYWIVKLSDDQNIIWEKSYGGSQNDVVNSIEETSDEGFILCGYSYSNDGDVTGHHGTTVYEDCWVVKLDSAGDLEWEKSLGGSSYDFGYSIVQTTDGGFIIAGEAYSNDGNVSGLHANTCSDCWVIKLDASGSLQWQKCLGGSNYENGRSIRQTIDGDYVIAGYTKSTDYDVSGNNGYADYWIVKLDLSGNLIWQKCFGGSKEDFAFSIQQTSDDGFIVAGYTYSSDSDVTENNGAQYFTADYWIVKLDSGGNMTWQKSLGGSNFDEAFSVLERNDGNFLIAGKTNSDDSDVVINLGSYDLWIAELDNNGNLVWQKCFGGSKKEGAACLCLTPEGGFVVAGYTYSDDGDVTGHHGPTDDEDCWIIKLPGDTITSVYSMPAKISSISPNPVTTQLQIQYTITQTAELMIYDALGRKVKSCSLPSNQKTFQLSVAELPSGVYLVAANISGQYFTEKMVKE